MPSHFNVHFLINNWIFQSPQILPYPPKNKFKLNSTSSIAIVITQGQSSKVVFRFISNFITGSRGSCVTCVRLLRRLRVPAVVHPYSDRDGRPKIHTLTKEEGVGGGEPLNVSDVADCRMMRSAQSRRWKGDAIQLRLCCHRERVTNGAVFALSPGPIVFKHLFFFRCSPLRNPAQLAVCVCVCVCLVRV